MIPTRQTVKTQIASRIHGSSRPVMSVSAGIGATSPAEEIDAAAEQVVWLMLFSRIPKGLSWAKSTLKPRQSA